MIAAAPGTAVLDPEPAPPGGPVSSLAELLGRQAADAMALSGARSSAWNGTVSWLPREGRAVPRSVVGIADWDGTIYYDRNYVERPMETLFATGGGELEWYELHRAKNALAVILHENCHLLASDPEDHTLTKARWSWPLVVLEEGATELFTQAKLNAYVARLGLDRLAPTLKEVESDATYPLFVPAVQTLTQGVGRLAGQPGSEVLRKVICEAGARKFQTLGAIVLQSSGLASRMPASHHEAAQEVIADAVRNAFGDVARIGPFLTPETSLKVSRRVGREALRGILLELEKLDAHYPNVVHGAMEVGARRRPILPPGIAATHAGHRRAPLDAGAARAEAGLTR